MIQRTHFCMRHRNVQFNEYKNVQYGNIDCDVKYYMSRMPTVQKKSSHLGSMGLSKNTRCTCF